MCALQTVLLNLKSLILKVPEGHRFVRPEPGGTIQQADKQAITSALKKMPKGQSMTSIARNMSSSLFLAVHIRSSDKANEVRHLPN